MNELFSPAALASQVLYKGTLKTTRRKAYLAIAKIIHQDCIENKLTDFVKYIILVNNTLNAPIAKLLDITNQLA